MLPRSRRRRKRIRSICLKRKQKRLCTITFADISLAQSVKIDKSLLKEIDAAGGCDGADSVLAKIVLLFLAIQKDYHVKLDADALAALDSVKELVNHIFVNMNCISAE